MTRDGPIATEYTRGVDALSRADFAAAVEIFGGIVSEDPDHGAAWAKLGVCYLELREIDRALDALNRAIRANPADADTYYLKGNAEGSAGRMDEAAACYRQALLVDPGHTKAEEFLMRTESLLESREHLRRAVRLLALEERTGEELNSCLRELVQSVAIFPNSPARKFLSQCAKEILSRTKTRAMEVPSESCTPHWRDLVERGYQQIQFQNWTGARQAYEEALDIYRDAAFIHHALGFAFLEADEPENAVSAWMHVQELDPDYDFRFFGRIKK